MKKLLFLFTITLLFSCNNDKNQKVEQSTNTEEKAEFKKGLETYINPLDIDLLTWFIILVEINRIVLVQILPL